MAMFYCPHCKGIVDATTKICPKCQNDIRKYIKELVKEQKKNAKNGVHQTIALSSVYDNRNKGEALPELDFLKPAAPKEPEVSAKQESMAPQPELDFLKTPGLSAGASNSIQGEKQFEAVAPVKEVAKEQAVTDSLPSIDLSALKNDKLQLPPFGVKPEIPAVKVEEPKTEQKEDSITSIGSSLGGGLGSKNELPPLGGSLGASKDELPPLGGSLGTSKNELPPLGGSLGASKNELPPLGGSLGASKDELPPLGGSLGASKNELPPLGGSLGASKNELPPLGGSLGASKDELPPLGGSLGASKDELPPLGGSLGVSKNELPPLGGSLGASTNELPNLGNANKIDLSFDKKESASVVEDRKEQSIGLSIPAPSVAEVVAPVQEPAVQEPVAAVQEPAVQEPVAAVQEPTATPNTAGTSSLYGAPAAPNTAGTNSLYGAPAAPNAAGTNSLYGAPATPNSAGTNSLYGAPAAPNSAGTNSLYGAPATPNSAGTNSLYGAPAAPNSAGTNSLYGAPTTPNSAGTNSLYGAPAAPKSNYDPILGASQPKGSASSAPGVSMYAGGPMATSQYDTKQSSAMGMKRYETPAAKEEPKEMIPPTPGLFESPSLNQPREAGFKPASEASSILKRLKEEEERSEQRLRYAGHMTGNGYSAASYQQEIHGGELPKRDPNSIFESPNLQKIPEGSKPASQAVSILKRDIPAPKDKEKENELQLNSMTMQMPSANRISGLSEKPSGAQGLYGTPQPGGAQNLYGTPQPGGAQNLYGTPQPSGAQNLYGTPQPGGAQNLYGTPQPGGAQNLYGTPQPSGAQNLYGTPQPGGAQNLYGTPQPGGAQNLYGTPQPSGAQSLYGTPQPSGANPT